MRTLINCSQWSCTILGLYSTPHVAQAYKSGGAIRDWRITLVRAKGTVLGPVEAPNAETAIEEAIRLFNVPEAQRSRPIAIPVRVGHWD